MTAAQFTKALQSSASMSQAFIEQLVALAETLTPDVRTDIVDELRAGEERQEKILTSTIQQVSDSRRHLKVIKRAADERADRSQESLPTFDV